MCTSGRQNIEKLPSADPGTTPPEELVDERRGRGVYLALRAGLSASGTLRIRNVRLNDWIESESPSTYLLMYLRNMEKKIPKSIQTQSTIIFNT